MKTSQPREKKMITIVTIEIRQFWVMLVSTLIYYTYFTPTMWRVFSAFPMSATYKNKQKCSPRV